MQSDFVPVLKTFSWRPIYSIVGSSSILRMLDDCYPYNIWYLAFCRELSFSVLYPGSILPQKFISNRRFLWIIGNSKQQLKGYSVLEIFVKNFPSVKTFVKHSSEAFVKMDLIVHLIIYLYAASWGMTIRLAAAIKLSHEQRTFYAKRSF